MRRKEKEISDRKRIEEILRQAQVCRVGFSLNDIPYVVPMNFAYGDNHLYLHSAKEGKKMEILRKNDTVCFEVDAVGGIIQAEQACDWGIRYESVIGMGKARIVEDMQEKKRALDILMQKYTGIPSWEYPSSQIERVTIIRIDIEDMTGKHS